MNVNKIGLIERIFKPKQSSQVKQTQATGKVDRVSLSSSAIEKSRLGADDRIKEIIKNTPDIRADKVNAVKAQIDTGNYFSSVDNELLADKIMKSAFAVHINLK